MNGFEFIVIECLKQKRWENALFYLNQLLDTDENDKMENAKLLAYLLWRSECFFELNNHEACARDCRKIMSLVPNEAPRNNFWFKSRWRLTHSLIQLKAFNEAKQIVQQLINLCTDFTKQECVKLLERIKFSSQFVNGGDKESKATLIEPVNEKIDKKTTNDVKTNDNNRNEKNSFFCIFCNILFEDEDEFRSHCSTQNHQQTIMSDEGRDWKKRPPPRGLTADTYNLCPAFGSGAIGQCKHGAQCVDAHGIEELNEWKERFEYRMMRLQRANEALLYGKSYTELLLNRLAETSNPELIMRETLEGVDEQIEGELTTIIDSKICDKKWVFTLHTPQVLRVVALLYDSHRNHFLLKRITTSTKNKKVLIDEEPINAQEWTSRLDDEEDEDLIHKVEVTFSTKLYGTFRQTVLFDFGQEPVLAKHICVDVVPVKDAEKMKEMQQELVLSSTERWEKSNAVIIPFVTTTFENNLSAREKELLTKYYVPTGHKFTITQSMINDDIVTMNNYRSRMHELLYIEEMACYEQVAKYSVRASVQIVSSYILSPSVFGASTAKFSTSGELFAMIFLNEDVSEDSPGGRLVLNNCCTVLLADERKVRRSKQMKKPKVYEALIEDKGKNTVYLRLSAQMVTELKLKADTSKTLEMQFQLNRIPFCEWHQAVDCISNYRIIFPDLLQVPELPETDENKWTEDDSKLNEKQKEAVVAITLPRDTPLPPVLIIGPFGTGKTYTLAQAIKHILKEPDSKILICTHSNSAADLYIKDYLHSYVKSGLKEATPLRIYYHKRWVSTVSSTVLEYCLTEVQNGTRIFKVPTLDDILKHRIIVVTLNIASHLSTIGLPRGHFTHILLDEAAQAIECEAIMPLALANEKTRIVLAGDHMQLSPEIFSSFARQKKFHVSLLQRLYESYPNDYPFKIILCENYRAHKAIVEFTSNLFYDNKLISVGGQPKHKKFYPLTFFTALGEDVQEKYSTGFYNCAEVYELVERVAELKNDWPKSWGEFNEHSIGIMSPYPDQVYRIRIELKKRRLFGIAVERVLNVQGKQFRVVFLSTVRTVRTCITGEIESENASLMDYGFLSNKKLLNTAVTRAQSLVAVVGDPVSLCSLGRCRKIWEMFIEICSMNNSLYGLTWQDLKSLLLAVEMKKKYKLNPLAPEFIPRCLHVEPYLQMLGSSSTISQPLTGMYPYTDASAGGAAVGQMNNIQAGRVYTYDNIRYQLPQKQPTVIPAAATVLPAQVAAPPPAVPATVGWSQSAAAAVAAIPALTAAPVVNPLNAGAAAVAVNHYSSVTMKAPPPPAQSQTTIRAPPGFPPLQVRPNSIVYPQVTSTPFAAANVFQPFTQSPATFIPPPTAVRNGVTTESGIPLHLTLIPLSQYMRSHPPPATYTTITSTAKTFSPATLPAAANFATANPVYGAPLIQNGYKPVINGAYVQNEMSYVSTEFPPATYTVPPTASPGTITIPGAATAVSTNLISTNQWETELKNILPPNISLAEILRNTVLQKQWLSHLVDSKMIQQAQMFLNLIGTYTVKETVVQQSLPTSTTAATINRRVIRGIDGVDMSAQEAYNLSRGSVSGAFAVSEAQPLVMNGGDKPTMVAGTPAKEYESVTESSIPLDNYLPSSLIPDLLPSSSKRAGPLYNRQPSKANCKPDAAEFAPHAKNPANVNSMTEQFSKNLILGDASSSYVDSYPPIAYKMENGDVELARRRTSSYAAAEYDHRHAATTAAANDLHTKRLFNQQNMWNLLPYSLHNENTTTFNDASAMTYAAALRQTQDKITERGFNDKSYFNFN